MTSDMFLACSLFMLYYFFFTILYYVFFSEDSFESSVREGGWWMSDEREESSDLILSSLSSDARDIASILINDEVLFPWGGGSYLNGGITLSHPGEAEGRRGRRG